MRRGFLLLLGVSLGGCGLLLEPPIDAGMDGSVRRDAGTGRPCADDVECDDGAGCNGVEACVRGYCVPGAVLTCDDGIDCTDDLCDEAEGCVSRPGGCPEIALECGAMRCDPALGCVFEPSDGDCDDGIACTTERCVEGSCAGFTDDSVCDPGHFCSADEGCLIVPACATDTECPPRVCNMAYCDSGTCFYGPIDRDSACSDLDPCVSTSCVGGSCLRSAIVCDTTVDSASCTRYECSRSLEGIASCNLVDRDGEPCRVTDACSTATCSGSACVSVTSCIGPCSTCTAMGCATRSCGTRSTCTDAGGTADCVCDAGWIDCDPAILGCECSSTCIGLAGSVDCNLDGTCDCDLSRGHCSSRVCRTCPTCGPGERCCPSTAACYDPTRETCP